MGGTVQDHKSVGNGEAFIGVGWFWVGCYHVGFSTLYLRYTVCFAAAAGEALCPPTTAHVRQRLPVLPYPTRPAAFGEVFPAAAGSLLNYI